MAIIGIKWPFFEITYFFSKEVIIVYNIAQNIAQKKHNCQVSGARTHNEVYVRPFFLLILAIFRWP